MSEAALTKDEILGADDRKVESLDMREFGWPGNVYIRVLGGNELEKVAKMYGDGIDRKPDYLAYMASLFICDENGERMFTDGDYQKLSKKAGMALQHIAMAGVRLNKIEDEDVEQAEKNLEATVGGDSSTA